MLTLIRQDDAVMDLVREIYYLRQKSKLVVDPAPIARRTVKAAAALVEAEEGYNPEADARVEWLRGLCRSLLEHPGRYPKASGESEAYVQFLLGELPPAHPRISNN
jgi:hypothetical protein